ncbi:MAG: hypothetical protein R6V02_12550 [Candidatus Aminicenantes bacterium]
MNKIVKIIIIILIIDAVAVGGYFLYRAVTREKSVSGEMYSWVEINEDYYPQDYIEEFIKSDSAAKGLLPVQIKNYSKDEKMLRQFVGTQFARPTQAQLRMMYPGLSDWQLVSLKHKTESGREVTHTILYIHLEGTWRVGDRGRLESGG